MVEPDGKLHLVSKCEAVWLQGCEADAVCPNCGQAGRAAQLIEVDYDLLGSKGHYRLQCCPHCSVRFADVRGTIDYAGDGLLEIGWPAYYAQLGAGIWQISNPLIGIAKPAGAKALEIGGAYGFGLDFCVNAKGWQGVGYDPSPLAGIGARELGLDIHRGYFTGETLGGGPWDVIISTEVIEHLETPPDFLRLMRRAVADDGILLLTTPNADWITPDLPNSVLHALLSPGAHVVLQTPQSLKMALEAAGFAHVVVRAEESALIAYASPSPFTLEEKDFAARRAVYRDYLRERGAAAPLGSDLQIGFAGRALFDAMNDQDGDSAEAAWAVLNSACEARFGYRLEALAALPPGAEATSLEDLGTKIPLGLGMILFARVMQRLAAGEDRQAVRPLLVLTQQAVAALQAALDQRSLERDRLSVSIAEVVRIELLLCDAEAGRPEAADALLALGDKVAGWRGIVALVNARAYEAASRLQAELLGALPESSVPAGLRRDALLSLANLHLAPGQDALQALPVVAALQAIGEPEGEILLGVFVRLVNGGRYDEALAFVARHDVEALAAQVGGEAAKDAGLARVVLELAVGDSAMVPARLEGLALAPLHRDALLLEVFIRLVNNARHAEAASFSVAHDVPALLAQAAPVTAADAATGLAVLELAQGDPARVPEHLSRAPVAAANRAAMILAAFSGLVSAGRYDEADLFASAQNLAPALDGEAGPEAADARLAAIVLALHQGRAAQAARQVLAWEARDERLAAYYVDAFLRLMNAGDTEGGRSLAEAGRLEAHLANASEAMRLDALAALVRMDALPGGDASLVAGRLDVLAKTGAPEERLREAMLSAFVQLVNRAQFGAAGMLAPRLEPELVRRAPPFSPLERDALFASGMLCLQDERALPRASVVLARLRDDLVKAVPPPGEPHPLFWPALRGEVVALIPQKRGTEALDLLRHFTASYTGAPDDLLQHLQETSA